MPEREGAAVIALVMPAGVSQASKKTREPSSRLPLAL